MNRADELTLRLADGTITDGERRELDALLADPEAFRAARALLEVEHALRLDRKFDAAPEILRRIRRTRSPSGVMARVHALRPAWASRRRLLPAAAALLIAALLAVAFLPRAPWATLAAAGPDTVLLRDGLELAALPGAALRPGDALRTGASRAEVAYGGETTRVVLEPSTEAALLREGDGAKGIELRRGEIAADVAPQRRPLRIDAPHARAEVLGTRLKLSVADEATRLEVEEGLVRWVRADGATVEVPARHYSVAAPEATLAPAPVVDATRIPRVTGFTLIQADTPRAAIPGYEALRDGMTLHLPLGRINLQAHTDPPRVGSLRFSTAGSVNVNTELMWPYTIIPNNGTGRDTWMPAPGRHTITATPFTGSYGNGLRGEPLTMTLVIVGPEEVESATPAVTGFSLIAADAPRDPIPGYEDLADGAELRLSGLRRFNLRANTSPRTVGSVRFSLADDASYSLERRGPYVVAAERAWTPAPGTVTVTATPYTRPHANGARGASRTITLRIVE